MNRSRIAACAALSALSVTSPAFGATDPHHHVNSATFSISIRGSQATTWGFKRPGDASACIPTQRGNGSQHIRFHNTGGHLITFKRDFVTGGPPIVRGKFVVAARVEREGETQMDRPIADRYGCHGLAPMPPVAFTGCGDQFGTIDVGIEFSGANEVRLAGTNPDFGGGSTLLTAYPYTCQLMVNAITDDEAEGALIDATERLSEKAIFNPRRKTLKVHADRVKPVAIAFVKGRTIVTYNVVLKRES